MNRMIRDISQIRTKTVLLIGLLAGIISAPLAPRFSAYAWEAYGFHLLLSSLVALAYSIILKSAHRSGLGVGLQIGTIHWLVAGLITPLVPIAPRFDFFMIGQGPWAMISFALMHFIYGAAIGVLFDRYSIRYEYPQPISG
jgi:hypothetical protein